MSPDGKRRSIDDSALQTSSFHLDADSPIMLPGCYFIASSRLHDLAKVASALVLTLAAIFHLEDVQLFEGQFFHLLSKLPPKAKAPFTGGIPKKNLSL